MFINSPFEENLPKNQANYSPLTPLRFLTRTAEVFPERTAVIHGEIKVVGEKPSNAVPDWHQH